MNLQMKCRRNGLWLALILAASTNVNVALQPERLVLSQNPVADTINHEIHPSRWTESDQLRPWGSFGNRPQDGLDERDNLQLLQNQIQRPDFTKRRLSSLRADLGRRAADSGKRHNRLRADLGKRAAEQAEEAEFMSSQEVPTADVVEGKRGRAGFRGDLGKRPFTLRGDFGKRASSFRGDLGKRARSFRGDLGKRAYSFRGDLGKRRSGFRGDLGKRDEEEKRYNRFDLGKRSRFDEILDRKDQHSPASPKFDYDDDAELPSFVHHLDGTDKQNNSERKMKTDDK